MLRISRFWCSAGAVLAGALFLTILIPQAASAATLAEHINSLVTKRLCDRQAVIDGRFGLNIRLVDPAKCQTAPTEPTLSFTADPTTIQSGQSSTLEWDSTNANSCTASDGWSGSKSVDGSQSVSPTSTTTYTLSCTGAGGTVNKSVTVTVSQAPATPTLTLVKTVTNNNGGTADEDDFQARIDGADVEWDVAQNVSVGSHTVSETGVGGYTASGWGGDCAANGTITLAAGENKTCTITNDDQAGTLVVKKVVIRDNGRDTATTTFSFQINGGSTTSFESDGQNDVTVDAGTYTVTEPSVSGWSASFSNCSNVVVSNGETEVCTITNNDEPIAPTTATLTLIKSVTNNNGGTTTASAWTLSADGPDDISGASGSAAVTNATVDPGTYTLSESGPGGYVASLYSCVKNGGSAVDGNSITLLAGDTATCTITNNDQQGLLIVKKVVIRDNGGDAATTTFSFQIDGGSATSFEADGQNDVMVDAGTYDITEPAVSGYTTTLENCTDVFVPNGGSATCTITNNDVAPETGTLVVKKVVIRDNGGDTATTTFSFQIDSGTVTAFEADGQNDVTVSAGTHSVTEPAVSGWTTSLDNCTNVVVSNGETEVCTITNNDNPSQQIDHLVISEVLYDVASTTTGAESGNEWIEVYNGTNAAINLQGWKVGNLTSSTTIQTSAIVQPGSYAVIIASTTPSGIPGGVTVVDLDAPINAGGLANGGDVVVLRNPSATIVDAVSWGSNTDAFSPSVGGVDDGDSIARIPVTTDTDSADDWEELNSPTPGQ